MKRAKYFIQIKTTILLGMLLSVFYTTQLVAQCTIACHDQVNVGLDDTCRATITYSMILQGEDDALNCAPNAPEDFSIFLSKTRGGDPLPNSPIVTGDDLGELYYATVVHLPTGTNCTGTIIVDDDSPPNIYCPTDTIVLCGAPTDTLSLGQAIAYDCYDFSITYTDIYENLAMTCNGLAGKITRTWRALSTNGKRSNCQQTIEIMRPDMDDLEFPPNRNGNDAPAVSCDSIGISIELTGVPSFDGIPIDLRNGLCGYSATFRDRNIDDCGSTFTIIRSWTVVDPCSGEVKRQDQTILVNDNQAPVINCPDTLRVGTTEVNECAATFLLPSVEITDNCSTDIGVVIQTPTGNISGNGGLAEQLPEGPNVVTYFATDECGKVGSCETIVMVSDQTAPSLTCEDRITVSLTDAGAGVVRPTSMVITASDDCCNNVNLDLRRMDADDDTFFESIIVDCSDVGQTLLFLNRGTDCNDNANICMVQVDVVDNSSTTEITCPENVTVSCTVDYDDPLITGFPKIIGFCNVPSAQATFVDQEDLTLCGTGTIMRMWTLNIQTDGNGSCTQTITVRDPSPVSVRFPDDLTLTQCVSPADLQPEDLDAPFNLPVVSGTDDCNNIDIDFEDLPIISEGGNCIVIRRVWTVIETCIYDPLNPGAGGIYEQTQRIIINESTPPVIDCPENIIVATGNDCVENVFIDGISVTGECLPDEVELTVSGDLGGGRFFVAVPPGVYQMNAMAADFCGNTSDCDFTVRVIDNVDPIADCLPQVIAIIGADETVTVFGANLNNNSSDNCTAANDLELRIGPAPAPGTTSPPANVPLTFICDDVGSISNVALWVGDEQGNWDFCTTTLQIADPQSNCTASAATAIVAGSIEAPNGSMVDEVEISIDDMDMPPSRSNAQGQFRFTGLPTDASYRLSAKRPTSFKDGLTTFDLVKLVQHLTGAKPLTNPYTQIAADVNGDNRISILDVITLQKLIINVQTEVATNVAWRFIPKDFIFPDPSNIFDNGFPEFKEIRGLQTDYQNADFIAVKIGDINQSFYPEANLNRIENRSGASLDIQVQDRNFEAGEEFDLYLSIPAPQIDLLGLQLGLQLGENLEVLSIKSPFFDQGLVFHQDSRQRLLLSAFTDKVLNTRSGILLTIRLKAHQRGTISNLLRLSDNLLQAEAILLNDQTIQNISLTFLPVKELSLAVSPNPFHSKTQIQLTSPEAEWVQYQIWNSNGQLLVQNQFYKNSGTDQLEITAPQLEGQGLYYLKVTSNSGTKVLKIIKQ